MTQLSFKQYFWSLALLVFFSCSTAKNYKTLSIFFDGVPNPETKSKVDSVKNVVSAEPLRTTKETVVIGPAKTIHPDYVNKSCEKCHSVDHAYRLKARQPDLCYQCHKPFESKFEKLHGPVAAGFCSACHVPHKSEYKGLLNMAQREVCQHCHEAGDVSQNEAHTEISTVECLDCHNSHGGSTAHLLKDNYPK